MDEEEKEMKSSTDPRERRPLEKEKAGRKTERVMRLTGGKSEMAERGSNTGTPFGGKTECKTNTTFLG